MMVISVNKNTIIWVTYASITLHSTNFWIQHNTLPYLLKKFGANAMVFGGLQTLFGVLQLFGSPLFGRIGDIIGARFSLLLAFASSLVSYLLLSVAGSISFLFISRIPIILMHGMQGGQMVLTDITTAEKRVGALAKLGVAYAVGMVIGNAVGGIFTKFAGVQASVLMAAVGTVANIALVFFVIPHNVKEVGKLKRDHSSYDAVESGAPSRETSQTGIFAQLLDLKKIFYLTKAEKTRYLLSLKLLTGVPVGILQSMFPIVAVNIFKVDPMSNGFVLAFIAVISMIVQGLILPRYSGKISDGAILHYSVVSLTISYVMMIFVTRLWQFCVIIPPMVLGLTSLNVVISSTLTKTVASENTGAILGVNMSLNNIIRIVSPTVGGWMLSRWGFSSLGWLGGAISVATIGYMSMSVTGRKFYEQRREST